MKPNGRQWSKQSTGLCAPRTASATSHHQVGKLVGFLGAMKLKLAFSGEDIGDEEQLVHWCHGATGVLHMLICAIQTFNKEDRYMKVSQQKWKNPKMFLVGPALCPTHLGAGNSPKGSGHLPWGGWKRLRTFAPFSPDQTSGIPAAGKGVRLHHDGPGIWGSRGKLDF